MTKNSARFGIAEKRAKNLRQLLLKAHRQMNLLVSQELARRGYDDIRLIHGRLLENLDYDGNSISVVAKRAQMTKQAMGALAMELETKGYLRRSVDENDGRIWRLSFTDKGRQLMLETFEIVAEIEARIVKRTGRAQFKALAAGLSTISDQRAG